MNPTFDSELACRRLAVSHPKIRWRVRLTNGKMKETLKSVQHQKSKLIIVSFQCVLFPLSFHHRRIQVVSFSRCRFVNTVNDKARSDISAKNGLIQRNPFEFGDVFWHISHCFSCIWNTWSSRKAGDNGLHANPYQSPTLVDLTWWKNLLIQHRNQILHHVPETYAL